MKIKSIIPPTLFISAVLALNGLATAIDTPEVYQQTEYKVVSNNPNAVGDGGESIGLMQIQPRWHQTKMEELGIVNLYDAQENVILGCAILSDLYDKYGNYEDALSVYNSGNTEDGKAYAERILRK